MKLFDSHFHYSGEESPEACQKAARSGNVQYLMTASAYYDDALKAAAFAEKLDDVWFAAGLHPHDSGKEHDFTQFENLRKHPKLKAVGEIGLDYFYQNAERPRQLEVFEKMLSIALDWKMPAVIHCRDKEAVFTAYDDSLALLGDFAKAGGTFELHCYSGTPAYTDKFLSIGAYFGISGILTFPKADNIREVFKMIPDDRIMLETDSPYLAPVPYRGKPNRPEYMLATAAKAASERGISLEEMAELTCNNTFRFFGIK